MVCFHVFAKPHRSFNVELSTFALLHSSPLFSLCYTLFSATGVPQPFVYQSLPHSFHCDGVYPPPFCLRPSEVQTCGRLNVLPIYPLCFQTLAHSFAHRKKLSHLLSWDSALSAQNTPGGGGCDGWSPKDEMTWTENLPNP